MGKWMQKIGALALSLALMLVLAGCGADVGIIGGESESAGLFTSTEAGQPEDTASGQGELAEAAEDEEPSSDPGAAAGEEDQPSEDGFPEAGGAAIDEDGAYDSAEDVSLYLHIFGHLPDNYITKSEARDLGWSGGSVEKYAPGCAIGGDVFGNREGVLPEGTYHECDIGTIGENSRGAKRLVYSDDGRIYYTEDHYGTFTLLYGEE